MERDDRPKRHDDKHEFEQGMKPSHATTRTLGSRCCCWRYGISVHCRRLSIRFGSRRQHTVRP